MDSFAVWSPRPNAIAVDAIADDVVLYGLPVIDITSIALTADDIAHIQQCDTLIFTSQYASKHCCTQIDTDVLNDKHIIAIGQTTANALSANNLTVSHIASPPYSSETLLNDDATAHINRVAIVGGEGGRNLLESAFVKQGKAVFRLRCYRRDKSNLSGKVMVEFIKKHSIAGILVTSCDIANAVFEHLSIVASTDYLRWPVFALSERIALCLQQLGFTQVIVAQYANQTALNESILLWWEHRTGK